jgi:hypothetical protein
MICFSKTRLLGSRLTFYRSDSVFERLGFIQSQVNTWLKKKNSFKLYFKERFEEHPKKTKNTERKKKHNYEKKMDQKLPFKPTNCVKKTFTFKSVQKRHLKTVQNKTVWNYATFYVKRRDFQDPKWHDFVILQGKTLWGVKKRSEALRGVK